MPTLLVSLGTSPAIVPEAFLLPDVAFDAVHVLTTASIKDADVAFVQTWFADHAPETRLTITRVAGFSDFRSEEEHFQFEEVLYRWWLECGSCVPLEKREATVAVAGGAEPPPGRRPRVRFSSGTHEPLYVCLAGGFKTMSSAMQKAAAVMGAEEVYHVLCDLPQVQQPKTASEIEAAGAGGHLHWIKLGGESGWPQFRHLRAQDFPLVEEKAEGCVRWVRAPDAGFRTLLRETVERSHNIAGAWEQMESLPFKVLATWPAAQRTWLEHRLEVTREADRQWVAGLPKVELHCHLGGFATHGGLLHQVRAAAESPELLPSLTEPVFPSGWPWPAETIALPDYMKLGDATGSKLLKDPGCLRRQCELLYDHLCRENILYAEIRCSPNNYRSEGRSAWDVLTAIRESFQRCMSGSCVTLEKRAASLRPAGAPTRSTGTVGPPFSSGTHEPPPADRRFLPFDDEMPWMQSRRNLPHREQPGRTIFTTFRLADSIPAERMKRWLEEREEFMAKHPAPWDDQTWRTWRARFPDRMNQWLDEGLGACELKHPAAADAVAGSLHHFDGQRYILDAWVVMPNHVHAIIKPLPGHPLREIMHSLKSFTAHAINKALGREGQLWQHESFDHILRSEAQFRRVRFYIEDNPLKAGLLTRGGWRKGMGLGLEVDSAGGEDAESRRLPPPSSTAPVEPQVSRGTPEPCCHVNLIIIATRKDGGDRSDISRHLALAVTAADQWKDGCRVVGVDLAGFEKPETRAALFATDFEPVHRVGLAVTVHAGENDDAEGIWQAVFKLNARRLGHALRLMDAPDLLRAVADRGIGVEMCPFANLQIKGFKLDPVEDPAAYPLMKYLVAGIPVTVNTDNPGISAASLTDNLLLIPRLCPDLTRLDMLRLLSHAADVAFLTPIEKVKLRARLEARLPS